MKDRLDDVFRTILTNYCNLKPELFEEYKEYTEGIFGEGFDFVDFHKISLGRDKKDIKHGIGALLGKDGNKDKINKFKEATSITDNLCAIYKISTVNLSTFYEELNHPLPCPNIINQEKVLIGN